MAKFDAWAIYEKGTPFREFEYQPSELHPYDVDIAIECCGICASDIHQADSNWGPSSYPIVPGHEIVGKVIGKGNEVTRLNIGDRVGVGPECFSCLRQDCEQCTTHEEQYCPARVWTYNSRMPDGSPTYGGYAKNIRLHHHFAIKIPDALPSQPCAPLLCAGITCYDPLVRWNVRGKKTCYSWCRRIRTSWC